MGAVKITSSPFSYAMRSAFASRKNEKRKKSSDSEGSIIFSFHFSSSGRVHMQTARDAASVKRGFLLFAFFS